MSKAKILDATKYRNNPKLVAKYLNEALATDDPALTTRAIRHLARVHRNASHCRGGAWELVAAQVAPIG